MPRPSPEEIADALDRLDQAARDSDELEALTVLARASQLPPLVGNRAAADILGVESANLHKQTGLPAPLYELPAGRFYDADAIRDLAARRAATDTTETETVPNG